MKIRLGEVAEIKFGYYGQPDESGTIPYLQARHFDEYGQRVKGDDLFLSDDEKANDNLLVPGDILFAGKGFRFFAAAYNPEAGKAVASSVFYIIKPDMSRIMPEFLVSVLNMPKSLLYFKQAGAGSSIPSIRKSELLDFSFNIVPLEEQKTIVSLRELFINDIQLTEALLQQKKILFQSAISKIIN